MRTSEATTAREALGCDDDDDDDGGYGNDHDDDAGDYGDDGKFDLEFLG